MRACRPGIGGRQLRGRWFCSGSALVQEAGRCYTDSATENRYVTGLLSQERNRRLHRCVTAERVEYAGGGATAEVTKGSMCGLVIW